MMKIIVGGSLRQDCILFWHEIIIRTYYIQIQT